MNFNLVNNGKSMDSPITPMAMDIQIVQRTTYLIGWNLGLKCVLNANVVYTWLVKRPDQNISYSSTI
jgi:hypothetical protein